MYMLFKNMITTHPGEVVPVSHLVFHFTHFRLPFPYPNTAVIPVNLAGCNFTDLPLLNSFQRFPVVCLIPSLQSDNNIQFFLSCKASGFEYAANSGSVRCHRFLHKNMFSLTYSLFKMFRPETGRSCQYNDIGQFNGMFVSIEI